MPNVYDLQICLSGGAANSDPNLSIGGAKGAVMTQDAVDLQNVILIGGVSIVSAFGNTEGTAVLDYEYISSGVGRFRWQTSGDAYGDWVDVSADGTYGLLSANGAGAVISVVAANMETSNNYNLLNVAPVANTLFDDISKSESYAGAADYRCFYLFNNGTEAFNYVEYYVAAQPNGADSYEIGVDPNGINDGSTPAELVADENTAPSNVTFGSHTGEGNSIVIGDISPGDMVALWIKRTVPASTLTGTQNDLSIIGVKALV